MTVGERTLYLRAARLITGRGEEVIEDAAVRVEDGRIAAAGKASEVTAPADASVPSLTYAQGTILPGLVDAHVHLSFRRGEDIVQHAALVSNEYAMLRSVQAARRILAAGVTTVREAGARRGLAQSLRDGIRDGLVPGPRILASGPPITTTTGHLWTIGYEADTADEAVAAVRRLVKEGADFIKVCATGGGMTPGSVVGRAQYTVEQLRALAEDAHRLGRHVAAHAHGTEGIARAVEAGIDTIEHVSWYDHDGHVGGFDEQVARDMAARGTFANIASSPMRELVERREGTTNTGGNPAMGRRQSLDRWEQAHKMRSLGVQVSFSTDAVYGWWDDGHDLSYLAQALVESGGFAPLAVIEMITAVPSRAIGWGDRLGTVEAGKLADLLVVEGNPAARIRDLHNVQAVIQGGALVTL